MVQHCIDDPLFAVLSSDGKVWDSTHGSLPRQDKGLLQLLLPDPLFKNPLGFLLIKSSSSCCRDEHVKWADQLGLKVREGNVDGASYLGLARTIYIWCVCVYTVFLAPGREVQIYGHIRCIYYILYIRFWPILCYCTCNYKVGGLRIRVRHEEALFNQFIKSRCYDMKTSSGKLCTKLDVGKASCMYTLIWVWPKLILLCGVSRMKLKSVLLQTLLVCVYFVCKRMCAWTWNPLVLYIMCSYHTLNINAEAEEVLF